MKLMRFCATAGTAAAIGAIVGCANSEEFMKGLTSATDVAVQVLAATQSPTLQDQTVVAQQPIAVQQSVAVQQPVVVQQPVAVQQPTVQQPTVQQPTVQQPTAVQRSVAVSAPVPTPQLPKVLPRTTAKETAVPEVRYGQVYVEKPATPEQVEEAKKAFVAAKAKLDQVRLNVEGADEATVTCLIAAFPQAVYLEIKETPLTSLSAVGCCTSLKELSIHEVKLPDLAPLGSLLKLEKLSLQYCTIPSLAPIGTLPNVQNVDLYGATLTDFSPLAGMPKLRTINYYATKVPPEGYASLGKLKQVTKFDGGLTKMTSLAWLREVPQTKELYLFAEKFDDYTPIGTLANLEKITFWSLSAKKNANPVGDLAFIAPCTKVKTLRIDDCDFTNLGAIAGMKDLKELAIPKAKQPVDVAVVRSLANLENLNLSQCEVKNFEAIVGHPRLERLDLTRAKGVASIKGLSGNKALWHLMITEGAFPQDEVLAVSNALKAVNRSFSLYVEKKR